MKSRNLDVSGRQQSVYGLPRGTSRDVSTFTAPENSSSYQTAVLCICRFVLAERHVDADAGRVRDALQTVMMFTDTNAYRDLTGRYGFTVVEVGLLHACSCAQHCLAVLRATEIP
jgi:hypothetical protein